MSGSPVREDNNNDSGVAPLRLRLTHRLGEVRSGAVQIPASGAGMADALQLCGERQSEAQWRVANMCRIAWHGHAEGWQLLNGSHTLMCVRNGERVQAGLSVPIAEGDTLELGLLRFQVEKEEGGFLEGVLPGEAVQSVPHSAAVDDIAAAPAPRADDEAAFELHDLAANESAGGRRTPQAAPLADPFGVLDITGAQSRPTADVLSELLGETPRSVPVAAAAQSARLVTPPAGNPVLLDELHEEFARVVRDPAQLAGRTDWEGFLAAGGEPAPTLDELRRQAEPYALLRDILLPREGIDRIIEDFEPLVTSGLLDADRPDDVLSLFAPELARDAGVPLPSLTRREHHDLSPDSHMHIGPARSGRDDAGEGDDRGSPQ